MILVLDASPLITLARIGSLGLLRQLADQIIIPDAVYVESVSQAPGRPGSIEIAQADWITRRPVENYAHVRRLRNRIGLGEAEAIVLAQEIRADAVVLDDATARHIAEQEGCRVVFDAVIVVPCGLPRNRVSNCLDPIFVCRRLRSTEVYSDRYDRVLVRSS